jgi:hypothetical protein
MPSKFDSIYNDIIDLKDETPDLSTKETLERAGELVLIAAEKDIRARNGQHLDLTSLGLRDERTYGRRRIDRRINVE